MTEFIDEVMYAGKQNVTNMAFDMDAYLDQKMIREIEEYAMNSAKKWMPKLNKVYGSL